MKGTLLALSAAILLAACTPSHLRSGMTRAEVISVMGEPNRLQRQGDLETLVYFYPSASREPFPTEYPIKLRNGQVVSWGPSRLEPRETLLPQQPSAMHSFIDLSQERHFFLVPAPVN